MVEIYTTKYCLFVYPTLALAREASSVNTWSDAVIDLSSFESFIASEAENLSKKYGAQVFSTLENERLVVVAEWPNKKYLKIITETGRIGWVINDEKINLKRIDDGDDNRRRS